MSLPLFKNFVDVIVLNHVTDYQKQQIELFFSSGGKKVQNANFQAWKKDQQDHLFVPYVANVMGNNAYYIYIYIYISSWWRLDSRESGCSTRKAASGGRKRGLWQTQNSLIYAR
jgi:hypothetical protein